MKFTKQPGINKTTSKKRYCSLRSLRRIPFLVSVFFVISSVFAVAGTDPVIEDKAREWMRSRPVRFTENKGQMSDTENNAVPSILFKASTMGMDVYITEKGLTYVFMKTEEEHKEKVGNRQLTINKEENREVEEKTKTEMAWINMYLKGASIKKENIIKEGESAEHFNYFYAHCPEGIYNVKSYEKIIIKNVYVGIDWVFYNSNNTGMKYDFIVHPNADPVQIKLVYESEIPLKINTDGDINIKTPLGSLIEKAPYSYILETGTQVKSSFTRTIIDKHDVEVSFNLTPHTSLHTSTLVIDPQVIWGTFYGGSLLDFAHVAETDKNGNLLVGGYTQSSNFPVQTAGTFFQGYNGLDAIILKFNNTGVCLWATYYGGNNVEAVYSIDTDNNSNIFLTGYTLSTNFPVQNAGPGTYFQPTGSSFDCFILKFNNAGVRLWATYFGGIGVEDGGDIAIDNNSGDVFITGYTRSNNFPLLNAGTYFQGVYGGLNDAFISKFSNAGALLWSTFYNNCSGKSIATDISGNIFVTGITWPSSIFQLQNASTFFQPALGGGLDAFILKFDNLGNPLWATYYGGNNNDESLGIRVDNNGNVFVHGYTYSTNFPTFNSGTYYQPLQGGPAGTTDAFILKFSNTGVRLWATLYGGNNQEAANRDELAIDNCGNVYLGIPTTSSDFPTYNSNSCNYFDNSYGNGGYDNALVMFDNNGNRLWASYFGDYGYDYGVALATDANNNLFMIGSEYTGYTVGTPSFIINPGGGAYFDNTFNGGGDIFISKFIPTPPTYTQSQSNAAVCNPCNGSATVNVSCGNPNYSYIWSNGNSTLNSTSANNTITGLCPGTYTVTATSNCNQTQTATFVITGSSCVGVSATATGTSICSGTCATVTSNGSAGKAPYTYSWSTGATTQNSIPSPCPVVTTTYTVTITDNAGTTATSTAVVTVNPVVTVTTMPTNINCNGGMGSATATGSSGTNPYTYSWSTGGSTSQISNLTSQIYTITVTDSKGCTSTATVAIISPPPLIGQFAKGTANCTGCGCKEWVMVNAAGGTSPYSYTWTDGYISRYKNQLCPGIYIVNIKDKKGCSVNVSVAAP